MMSLLVPIQSHNPQRKSVVSSHRQWIIMAIYSSLLCTKRALKAKGSGVLPDDSWLCGSIRSRLSSNSSICDLITVSSFLIHSNSSILTEERQERVIINKALTKLIETDHWRTEILCLVLYLSRNIYKKMIIFNLVLGQKERQKKHDNNSFPNFLKFVFCNFTVFDRIFKNKL